jgi:autotransporter-associated beta strand protein
LWDCPTQWIDHRGFIVAAGFSRVFGNEVQRRASRSRRFHALLLSISSQNRAVILAHRIALRVIVLMIVSPFARAGSATWSATPMDGDWFTAANWTPATVPNGYSDTATFAVSNLTNIVFSGFAIIGKLTFTSGASPYFLTINPQRTLAFSTGGIINSSQINQTVFVSADAGGESGMLVFKHAASAGSQVTYITQGNFVFNLGNGGLIIFENRSSGSEANFINRAATAKSAFAGRIIFTDNANAGHSTITNEGAAVDSAAGGFTSFDDTTGAGNALIVTQGGTAPGGKGGLLLFAGASNAGSATLVANDATNRGQSAVIQITENAQAGSATFKIFGNAVLTSTDILQPTAIGSLEGDGAVVLANKYPVRIGGNSRSTTFCGRIGDGPNVTGEGGSIIKIGNGTLTLSGPNTYRGTTTVSNGLLLTTTEQGSATGSGPIQVDAGGLGGTSTLSGPVTIGTGSGAGANLAPGVNGPGLLTTLSSLTFNADATYRCEIDSDEIASDRAVANGVTIHAGAVFSFIALGSSVLPSGTILTVIQNTATDGIAGTFDNLPDGGIITAGANTYQVNYEGGDGNDLTLTVMP